MTDGGPTRAGTSAGGQVPGGFADLLGDLVRDLAGLVKSEGRLIRSELTEAGRTIAVGVEMMVAGAILLLVSLIVLAQALVIGLAELVGPGWAATIVAALLGAIGALLVVRGRKAMAVTNLLPERTIEQTGRDIRLAKETL